MQSSYCNFLCISSSFDVVNFTVIILSFKLHKLLIIFPAPNFQSHYQIPTKIEWFLENINLVILIVKKFMTGVTPLTFTQPPRPHWHPLHRRFNWRGICVFCPMSSNCASWTCFEPDDSTEVIAYLVAGTSNMALREIKHLGILIWHLYPFYWESS